MLLAIFNFFSISLGAALIIFGGSYDKEKSVKENFTSIFFLISLAFLVIYQLFTFGYILSILYAIVLFVGPGKTTYDNSFERSISVYLGIVFLIKGISLIL